jgi:hypothetical protein
MPMRSSAFLAVAHSRAAVAQVVGGQHQLARAFERLAAEGRELAAPADAVEQRLAQLGFERTDAAAERGLGQEQRRRPTC